MVVGWRLVAVGGWRRLVGDGGFRLAIGSRRVGVRLTLPIGRAPLLKIHTFPLRRRRANNSGRR